jgi:hypothetical protein
LGLKLNGTHQLLVYADDVYLLVDNINTIKKKNKALIDASKEVSLEGNTEKTYVYVILSPVCRTESFKMANALFENVAKFKYLEMVVANQNLIPWEIKSIKITVHKTIIFL